MAKNYEVPDQLRYTHTHEWIRIIGEHLYEYGITDYAQHALGDVVFVDLPGVGDRVTARTAYGSVESVKAVSDLISGFSGEVTEVNEVLADRPELINESPYNAWTIRVKGDAINSIIMDAEAYKQFCAGEGLL